MQGTDVQLVAKFSTCQKFLVPSGLGSTTAGSLRCVCGFVPRVADGWHNSVRGYPRAVRPVRGGIPPVCLLSGAAGLYSVLAAFLVVIS